MHTSAVLSQQAQRAVAVMQGLTPPQLAGVLGAILTSENISKPQIWVAYEPTAEVVNAVQMLEPERERLYKVQAQHGVQAPLAIDLRLAGMAVGRCMQTHFLSEQGSLLRSGIVFLGMRSRQ